MSGKESKANVWRFAIVLIVFAAFAAGAIIEFSAERQPVSSETTSELRDVAAASKGIVRELGSAAVRLPIAALLGTVLALRPRRWGSMRNSVVVQTQIVLAVVGALILLVVGASLARAFGIVGVASLVRYRSRVDDPKDAVVMLAALAVGLACGVGLFFLAFFSTLFLVATLWVIESFEPETRAFDLKVRLGEGTDGLRSRIEGVLRKFASEFELRSSSVDEASYLVRAQNGFSTVRATEALTALVPDGKGSVEWTEKSKVK